MNIKNRNWFQGLNVQKKLTRAAELIELLLGVIILLHCIVSTAGMVFSVNVVKLFYNTAYLQYQLSSACLIIIGVELIMMITSYSLDSVDSFFDGAEASAALKERHDYGCAVVDVMLLAVSRQMIVEHTAPLENLLTVISVGLLFLIRKYLYISKIDKRAQSGKESESNSSAKDK